MNKGSCRGKAVLGTDMGELKEARSTEFIKQLSARQRRAWVPAKCQVYV